MYNLHYVNQTPKQETMKKFSLLDTSAIGMIMVLALFRLIPHWPNFTPVAAIALAGGAAFASKRSAILVPLIAMAISDLALGLLFGMDYAVHGTQVYVYASLLATVGLGMLFRSAKGWQTTVVGGSLASVLFFVVTNAAVWFEGSIYPKTIAGLAACYAAGLAFYDGSNFFLNSLASTWLFTGLFMASFAAVRSRVTAPAV
jgi:hypothetical protein